MKKEARKVSVREADEFEKLQWQLGSHMASTWGLGVSSVHPEPNGADCLNSIH